MKITDVTFERLSDGNVHVIKVGHKYSVIRHWYPDQFERTDNLFITEALEMLTEYIRADVLESS